MPPTHELPAGHGSHGPLACEYLPGAHAAAVLTHALLSVPKEPTALLKLLTHGTQSASRSSRRGADRFCHEPARQLKHSRCPTAG